MVQPGMDDLPLVTPAGAEIQKWGAFVLKLAKEFERIAGGRRRGVDRLRLEPTIPFLKHLGFPLVLSHRRRVLVSRGRNPPILKGLDGSRWLSEVGFLRDRSFEAIRKTLGYRRADECLQNPLCLGGLNRF